MEKKMKKEEELEMEVEELKELIESKERTIEELKARAESYKYQLIVYKGLFEKIIDKLVEGKDREGY
jgi:predicted RNase H-like nuclease (RuvC/YqgF family)